MISISNTPMQTSNGSLCIELLGIYLVEMKICQLISPPPPPPPSILVDWVVRDNKCIIREESNNVLATHLYIFNQKCRVSRSLLIRIIFQHNKLWLSFQSLLHRYQHCKKQRLPHHHQHRQHKVMFVTSSHSVASYSSVSG